MGCAEQHSAQNRDNKRTAPLTVFSAYSSASDRVWTECVPQQQHGQPVHRARRAGDAPGQLPFPDEAHSPQHSQPHVE